MPAVLSLGSVNADFQARADQRPQGSGTTLTGDLLRTSGGKGANVAVLVRRLGSPSVLLGGVGDDDLAEQALAGPRRDGVGLDHVARVRGATGFAAITVAPDGDKSILLSLGANDAWGHEADAVAAPVRAAPAGSVLVVDFEVPTRCVRAAVDVALDRGHSIVVDPAPPERVVDDVLDDADHVTPDHREAQALTGIDARNEHGALAAAVSLARRTGATAHLKLASGGCAVADAHDAWIVQAPGVEVIDKTGAGDAFAGGLAWALLHGLAAPEAAAAGVAAASLAVTAFGSQESYPARASLDAVRGQVRIEDQRGWIKRARTAPRGPVRPRAPGAPPRRRSRPA